MDTKIITAQLQAGAQDAIDHLHELCAEIEGLHAEIERLRKLLRDIVENVSEALKHE